MVVARAGPKKQWLNSRIIISLNFWINYTSDETIGHFSWKRRNLAKCSMSQ